MICIKCGNNIPEGTKICPYCGNTIEQSMNLQYHKIIKILK